MSNNLLLNIADKVYNRPLLLHPSKATILLDVLSGKIGLEGVKPNLDHIPESHLLDIEGDHAGPNANRFVGSYRRDNGSGMSPAINGVAIISVVGSTVNRGAYVGASSGVLSYEGVSAQMRDAESDPEIHTILLDMDCPGGEATGMFGLAKQVRDTPKKVIAYVNDVAASAGYGIISGADEIVVSPTSVVGSIGVVLVHMDRSQELAEKGQKPTMIFAGAHKVDANPFMPLPENVRNDLQKEVMTFYDLFLETVAIGRTGILSKEDAQATEARTFIGQEAIDVGLADRIASFDELIDDLVIANGSSGSYTQPKGKPMSAKHAASGANAGKETEITQGDLDAARAEGKAEGIAEGETKGHAASLEKVAKVTSSEEAKGREATALTLALNASLSADDAIQTLATLPVGAVVEAPATNAEETNAAPQSVEDRAKKEAEFGKGANLQAPKGDAVKASWGKTTEATNKRRGFAA